MSYPPCARWPEDSASALRRIRAGIILSEQFQVSKIQVSNLQAGAA
jgi:hypothetical protein